MSVVRAGLERGGVDRRDRQPQTQPDDDEHDGRPERVVQGSLSPSAHHEQCDTRPQQARGCDHARPEPPQQAATDQRAHGERDQEAHQHQCRRRLGVGHGQPRQDGDVDHDGDQRHTDQEAHHERRDHAAAQQAPRQQRLASCPVPPTVCRERRHPQRRENNAPRADHLALRVG